MCKIYYQLLVFDGSAVYSLDHLMHYPNIYGLACSTNERYKNVSIPPVRSNGLTLLDGSLRWCLSHLIFWFSLWLEWHRNIAKFSGLNCKVNNTGSIFSCCSFSCCCWVIGSESVLHKKILGVVLALFNGAKAS